MSSILVTILRSGLGFGLLLIFTRIIGNKQLGQLNIFTYISGIAIGAMAGAMAILHDIEVLEAVIGIAIWGTLTVIFEKSSLKNKRLRSLFTGGPIFIIKDGILQRAAMKKERLNIDDLAMLLRSNEIFSISEVRYAILEPNGELSVLRKKAVDKPIRLDLELPAIDPPYLPSIVISDGRVLDNVLLDLGKDLRWLNQNLAKKGIHDIKKVFYAEIQADGSLRAQTENHILT